MPRRILVLNERDLRNPRAGGAEVHLFEILKRLVSRGDEVTLLAASFRGSRREELVQGVRVRRLANRYLYYLAAPLAARREAGKGSLDLVIDVLNKLPFLSPWFVPLPCFVIAHHLFGVTAFRQVALPLALATWLAERLVPAAYRSSVVLAISPSTKQDLVARGLPEGNVWVVPPGVDRDVYRPSAQAGGSRGMREPTILWVGRLEPYKRADLAIDAVAGLRRRRPGLRLIVLGSGSAKSSLEKMVERRGLAGTVFFKGFIDEQEKVRWLQRSDVLVHTSEKEGWGMTVIEAAACGTPSVAPDVAGLRDSISDGRTGLLVPFGDSRALEDALDAVLGDGDLRASLTAGCREWAGRFDWEQVADDTVMLIEQALGPTATGPRLSSSPFGA